MSLVLFLIALGAVVVCVLFGLGYFRGGMDGPRNGGFPYPHEKDEPASSEPPPTFWPDSPSGPHGTLLADGSHLDSSTLPAGASPGPVSPPDSPVLTADERAREPSTGGDDEAHGAHA